MPRRGLFPCLLLLLCVALQNQLALAGDIGITYVKTIGQVWPELPMVTGGGILPGQFHDQLHYFLSDRLSSKLPPCRHRLIRGQIVPAISESRRRHLSIWRRQFKQFEHTHFIPPQEIAAADSAGASGHCVPV